MVQLGARWNVFSFYFILFSKELYEGNKNRCDVYRREIEKEENEEGLKLYAMSLRILGLQLV